ncbi:hypothetical protein DPEC_G00320850 [Dallia pectoralis]|uniref:Uncharacterized protein n=1 Tax=Dallia pectoralis TaxID=75939 RepID=A0ACC2FA68_DALPE|nr:hypothetical protein DPEC_G00320850 [Dallia pectoralis]
MVTLGIMGVGTSLDSPGLLTFLVLYLAISSRLTPSHRVGTFGGLHRRTVLLLHQVQSDSSRVSRNPQVTIRTGTMSINPQEEPGQEEPGQEEPTATRGRREELGQSGGRLLGRGALLSEYDQTTFLPQRRFQYPQRAMRGIEVLQNPGSGTTAADNTQQTEINGGVILYCSVLADGDSEEGDLHVDGVTRCVAAVTSRCFSGGARSSPVIPADEEPSQGELCG